MRRGKPVDIDLPILENVPLAPRTTLEVGGPARFYAEPHSPETLKEALLWAEERRIVVTLLGGGSNLLIADRGISGLVLRIKITGIKAYSSGPSMIVEVGGGEDWDSFVAKATESEWAGVECLSGIPGFAGATPIQNVGAYGQEVSETIQAVRAIDRSTFEEVVIPSAECDFEYRDSAFKRRFKDRFAITQIVFKLTPNGAPAIRYGELSRALHGAAAPGLTDVRNTVLSLRRAKSMVHDLSDENHRSAGSFFTNPIVPESVLAGAREAAEKVLAPGEKMPEFPAGAGLTKLAAGWLIERSGFPKGTADGPVGLSTKHALAIVNRGSATATQIVAFASNIKKGVYERFGVTLMPEPVLTGFLPEETEELLQSPKTTSA